MPAAKKAFLFLYWTLVALYLAIAVAVLGLRYVLLPRIDDFRPRIEAAASQALGAPVSIGRVQADWSGLNPRLRLRDVKVAGEQGVTVLGIPQADAVLSWRSVLVLSPRLLGLQLRGVELAVRRDAQGRLWLAGRSFAPGADGGVPAPDHPALKWLLSQRDLAVRDATVRWLDELRGAPELVLTGTDIRLRNRLFEHAFALSAHPPGGLAAGLVLRGDLRRRVLAADGGRLDAWNGQIYAELQDAEPLAWRPWLAMPPVRGRVAARAWVDLARGEPASVLADVALRGAAWQAPGGGTAGIRARSFQARLSGRPQAVLAALGQDRAAAGQPGELALQAQGEGIALHLPGVFADPVLALDTLQADAVLRGGEDGPAELVLRRLAVANRDLAASVDGLWRDDAGAAGSVDLQGTLERADLAAVHRYMPLAVEEDVRQWLHEGLLAGRAAGAGFVLRGPLAAFPYGDDPSLGQFRIAGSYAGAIIDYAPAGPDRLPWPRLAELGGTFEIERTALRLRAQSGVLQTSPEHTVALQDVQAEIADMEHQATLALSGRTHGSAAAYLALMTGSPLGGLLDHVLDQARGTGQWQVPLTLSVPLNDVDETTVSGSVEFDGASLAARPGLPVLERIEGSLAFSDKGVSARDLRAHLLGGPVRASGELARGSPGLQLAGTATAQGLRELYGAPAMRRLTGRTDYSAKVAWLAPSVVDVSVASSLAGLGIDLPAPLGKAAAPARALEMRWGPAQEAGGARRWLTASLAGGVVLQLEADPDAAAGTFRRGVLAVGQPARMPAHGMRLAGTLPELDLAAWQEAAAEFEDPKDADAGPGALLPPLTGLDLASRRVRTDAMDLDDVSLQAERAPGAPWQATVDARQVAGTVEWLPATDAAPARASARLSRLALAEPGGQGGEAPLDDGDFADVPDLDVTVADLRLAGRPLGELALSGSNVQRGQRWRLQSLRLRNDAASLQAGGMWRLSGASRGLDVQAELSIADLGRLLDYLGLPGRVAGGKGEIKGRLAWGNLPWAHRYVDLAGSLDVALEQGRFSHVDSRSARLLELLSLQSVQRLARLDFQPGSLLREGFPFDSIGSRITLGGGQARTEGLNVSSPVATISLAGSTDLAAQTWDLEAAVVPKLDASGAAIAAGIAVNPLIGLGAFLTQWVLKEPLARALTAQYTVRGTWDEPRLAPLEKLPPADAGGAAQGPARAGPAPAQQVEP